jgi:hypothetical protein
MIWKEFLPSEREFEIYGASLCIDGFDYEHPIHVLLWKDNDIEITIYHNYGQQKDSSIYWGIHFSDGDGDCYGPDLEGAKLHALKIKS